MIDRLIRLTRAEYFTNAACTASLTVLAALLSLREGASIPWWLFAFLGMLCWTLYEYGVHRWMLHGPLWRDVHLPHHLHPKDHIGLHPAITLAIYALGWLIFGMHSSAFMVGFSIGYVWYAVLHTALHYGGSIASCVPALRKHHELHHVRRDEVNFGVTTMMWDRLFGTHAK